MLVSPHFNPTKAQLHCTSVILKLTCRCWWLSRQGTTANLLSTPFSTARRSTAYALLPLYHSHYSKSRTPKIQSIMHCHWNEKKKNNKATACNIRDEICKLIECILNVQKMSKLLKEKEPAASQDRVFKMNLVYSPKYSCLENLPRWKEWHRSSFWKSWGTTTKQAVRIQACAN